MKLLPLLLAVLVLSASPILSQAEVYKWKDKDGTIKYSDTPPPSNIKQETVKGKRKQGEPTGKAPLAPVDSAVAKPANVKNTPDAPSSPEESAAKQRQKTAEAEKRNKQEKEAEAKRKADNCTAAKSNMETYTQGGRVYKMNEKGEREYMGEKDFAEGKQKAQQEINENC